MKQNKLSLINYTFSYLVDSKHYIEQKNLSDGLLGFCTILFADYLLSPIHLLKSANPFWKKIFNLQRPVANKKQSWRQMGKLSIVRTFLKKYFPFVYAERLTCIYRTISQRLTLKETCGTTWIQSEGLDLIVSKCLKALNH